MFSRAADCFLLWTVWKLRNRNYRDNQTVGTIPICITVYLVLLHGKNIFKWTILANLKRITRPSTRVWLSNNKVSKALKIEPRPYMRFISFISERQNSTCPNSWKISLVKLFRSCHLTPSILISLRASCKPWYNECINKTDRKNRQTFIPQVLFSKVATSSAKWQLERPFPRSTDIYGIWFGVIVIAHDSAEFLFTIKNSSVHAVHFPQLL